MGERRALWARVLWFGLCSLVLITLVSLGNWQLRRLAWKQDLIAAIEERAFAPAVEAPSAAVDPATVAYQRVYLRGRFDHTRSRRVKAITELGAGSWLMVPLETADGVWWVNRGFVPNSEGSADWTAPLGVVRVEGLLRPTEPDGTWLEKNDPANGRWTSRDVRALSADIGVGATVNYFIDADHTGAASAFPRGGLTIISFRNSHLVYALTWYTMALLLCGGLIYAASDAASSDP